MSKPDPTHDADATHAAGPTRPFDCSGCERPIHSREIHHVESGPAEDRDVYCPDCAPAARAGTTGE